MTTLENVTGHEITKTLAQELGMSIADLLVLARGNDPYSIGTPAHMRDAQWFADLWCNYGFSHGVHLRRIHYQLLSHGDVLLPDGAVYENTEAHWSRLSEAGKKARILDLVNPLAFTDRRNPEPHINYYGDSSEPYLTFTDTSVRWFAFGVSMHSSLPAGYLPEPEVSYDCTKADQPYLLEVWIEKSTMNDVLVPLCSEMGVNLVTSIGFQSLTASVNLLSRAVRSGKPARVLYISDFDPAGKGMPVAVARQCQYQLEQRGVDADLAIEHLMMTPQQVQDYQLPRVPIKESDRRKAGFEERYGTGAVELDALEALHPGEFRRVVRHAIQRYQDSTIADRMQEVEDEAQELITQQWADETAPIRQQIAEVREEISVIYEKYRDPVRALANQMDCELKPINERLAELKEEFTQTQYRFSPELPDKPYTEPDGPVNDDPLFSSERDYIDQLTAFNRHGSAA
jgi:hypothetical protein